MRLQYQKAVTQPVRELNREGLAFLLHTKTPEHVIASISHLAPVKAFMESKEYRRRENKPVRLIFLTEEESCARQAAMAFMSLKEGQKKSWKDLDEETGGFLNYVMTNLAEELDQIGEDEEKPEKGPFDDVTWETDFLIREAAPAGGSPDELAAVEGGFARITQSTEQNHALKRVESLIRNVYVNCFKGTLNDRIMDTVRDMKKEVIIMAVPDHRQQQYYLRRLSFEQDFVVIRIPKPESGYYERLMTAYLHEWKVQTAQDVEIPVLVQKLKSYRGTLFSEQDIFRLTDKAMEHSEKEVLEHADFELYGEAGIRCGMKKLNRLIGLANVKRTLQGLVAVQRYQSDVSDLQMHRNLVFSGPPGTGKSVVAQLYGEILAEIGVSNGKFVSAARKDMIGQYLGHTAMKMHALFERADGGVLFIDEAGSLAADDEYTKECITELVRYMEERPQTTVIFASYPAQIEAFLSKDPGLSSRIRKTVRFEGYTDEELCRIFELFAGDAGWELDQSAGDALLSYIRDCRVQKQENFGNAREMRKLLETAIETGCLRWMETGNGSRKIRSEDLEAAGKELLPEKSIKRTIGFEIGK